MTKPIPWPEEPRIDVVEYALTLPDLPGWVYVVSVNAWEVEDRLAAVRAEFPDAVVTLYES